LSRGLGPPALRDQIADERRYGNRQFNKPVPALDESAKSSPQRNATAGLRREGWLVVKAEQIG
jgi:hypothetical protein